MCVLSIEIKNTLPTTYHGISPQPMRVVG
ncbi:hypothetical protein M2244_001676 [Rhodoferax antarcticus]|nr:hypothetical protein [Rhodoferax antarcticus]